MNAAIALTDRSPTCSPLTRALVRAQPDAVVQPKANRWVAVQQRAALALRTGVAKVKQIEWTPSKVVIALVVVVAPGGMLLTPLLFQRGDLINLRWAMARA